MTTPTRRLAVLATAAAALAVSACSSPLPSSSGAEPPAVTTTTVAGATTPAMTKGADLRAQLTALMVEHVYLVGRVVRDIAATGAVPTSSAAGPAPAQPPAPGMEQPGTVGQSAPAVATGGTQTSPPAGGAPPTSAATPTPGGPAPAPAPAPTTTSAAAPGLDASTTAAHSTDSASELDRNSRDLATLLGAAYSGDFTQQFQQLWTQRTSQLEAYAQARVGGSGAAASAATDALSANATALAKLFHANNKYIEVHTVSSPGTGLADELGPDNTAVTEFIDAQVSKDPAQVTKLVAAAEKMPHTAEILAAAAAKLSPETYPGTVTGSAANLRASITASLVEHVELADLALEPLAANRDPGPAVAALDANGRQLANVFAAVYTDQDAMSFLTSWRSHIGFFVDYAKAKAGNDPTAASTAAGKLDEYTHAVGAFLAGVTKNKLPADAVARDFKMHVSSLLAVVDGAASHAPDETARVRTAAGHMPGTAAALSEAIAEQFPAKYLP